MTVGAGEKVCGQRPDRVSANMAVAPALGRARQYQRWPRRGPEVPTGMGLVDPAGLFVILVALIKASELTMKPQRNGAACSIPILLHKQVDRPRRVFVVCFA